MRMIFLASSYTDIKSSKLEIYGKKKKKLFLLTRHAYRSEGEREQARAIWPNNNNYNYYYCSLSPYYVPDTMLEASQMWSHLILKQPCQVYILILSLHLQQLTLI